MTLGLLMALAVGVALLAPGNLRAWAVVPVCAGVALAAEPSLATTLGEEFRGSFAILRRHA
jgi:hypothetical protein